MVTLSPPNFLSDGGLDGFEAAADRIFRDLMRLRRCVVLFDECEDFFKPRPRPRDRAADADTEANPERPESRTIGAFLTAGMLPRRQALRDNRWVIFVLATNSGPRDLDDAVIRLGRFDFAQEIDHPVLEAQCAYVDGHFTLKETPQREILKKALRKLDEETKDADKRTAQDADMPFAVIDSLARDIVEGRLKPTEAALSKGASEASKGSGASPAPVRLGMGASRSHPLG
jgi:SpoVK/Ycf46/Vps4 family AAA+-type ATPase